MRMPANAGGLQPCENAYSRFVEAKKRTRNRMGGQNAIARDASAAAGCCGGRLASKRNPVSAFALGLVQLFVGEADEVLHS
jgi:hypothetical protein